MAQVREKIGRHHGGNERLESAEVKAQHLLAGELTRSGDALSPQRGSDALVASFCVTKRFAPASLATRASHHIKATRRRFYASAN